MMNVVKKMTAIIVIVVFITLVRNIDVGLSVQKRNYAMIIQG